ncbi:MAG: rRNA pseudouridine synthase [Kiritimatiellae bacterium]|nr:rRNA pseudouridine synthase [Kiritimatiellia bacterium]
MPIDKNRNEDTAQGERLQSALSHRGVCSRRHAADLIASGVVSVNGKVVLERGFRVNPATDEIRVSGKLLPKEEEEPHTILLYKPRGVICSADNSRGETVCDLMREEFSERLVPVGRLDKDTEGLLLMSNDGEFCKLMTHPRYGCVKIYQARVAGHMTEEKLRILRSRMEIDGYLIRPVVVEVIRIGDNHVHRLQFTLTEGRNRQIRKMCEIAGFTVLELKRVRIGPLRIGKMEPGDWRELSLTEVESLKRHARAIERAAQQPEPPRRRRR